MLNRLLPLLFLLCVVLACADSEKQKTEVSPAPATEQAVNQSKAVTEKALSYFNYSTPDEWSKTWLTSATVSDSGALIIQVSNAWFGLPRYERRQLARQIEQRWEIALQVGGKTNPTVFITIKDVSGHTVGGSRLTGVWVEE